MKALLATFSILVAAPLFAQDDLGAFGGLLGGDVGISAPTARGAAPAPASRGNAPAPDRLLRLKDALAKANAPLAKDQETALNALLDVEVPIMRKSLQEKAAELGLRPVTPTAPPGTPQAGQRGPAAQPPALDGKTEAALRRLILGLNDQLLKKVISVPSLRPEQQAILNGLYKDQIRARGGLDAIQLALEEAGAAFTPEQLSQVQPIFDEQDQVRLELQRAATGPLDPAKVAQMEQTTLLRVLRLMTPEQRAALQKASARPQP
jgi:hypothetical protein